MALAHPLLLLGAADDEWDDQDDWDDEEEWEEEGEDEEEWASDDLAF